METWVLALAIFLLTVILVQWRPGEINEAVPALMGAFALFLVGFIDRPDILQVMKVVWNSAMTIISTFIMASFLEGVGFFRWAGDRLIERARDSGHRLFHLVMAFSLCLTLFLNNDGSILLGTPVVIGLVRRLRLAPEEAFAYLIGACLIASASSPPIGVSNMANLEAMSLVGISLLEHLKDLFIAAVAGLAASWLLLGLKLGPRLPLSLSRPRRPESLRPVSPHRHPHPVLRPLPGKVRHPHPPGPPHPPEPPPIIGAPLRPVPSTEAVTAAPPRRMWWVVAVVILVRLGFFVASLYHIPTSLVAMSGAAVLLIINQFCRMIEPETAIRRAPWPILGFALGMDLVVFGLRNVGLIGLVSQWLGAAVGASAVKLAFLPGILVALLSSLLNNHAGLIIGALTLLQLKGISHSHLNVAYASTVLGTDLGALMTPVGTLASLLWFHLLRQNGYRYTWKDYAKVSLTVIPLSFLIALGALAAVAMAMGV